MRPGSGAEGHWRVTDPLWRCSAPMVHVVHLLSLLTEGIASRRSLVNVAREGRLPDSACSFRGVCFRQARFPRVILFRGRT